MYDPLGFFILKLIIDLWKHCLKKYTLNAIYGNLNMFIHQSQR